MVLFYRNVEGKVILHLTFALWANPNNASPFTNYYCYRTEKSGEERSVRRRWKEKHVIWENSKKVISTNTKNPFLFISHNSHSHFSQVSSLLSIIVSIEIRIHSTTSIFAFICVNRYVKLKKIPRRRWKNSIALLTNIEKNLFHSLDLSRISIELNWQFPARIAKGIYLIF